MIDFDNNEDTVIEDIKIVSSSNCASNEDQRSRYTGAIPKGSTQSALLKLRPEHLPENFRAVVNEINHGYKICVILRGLPGCGKSYLSDQLIRETVKNNPNDHIFSADKYFVNARGIYRFDPSRLPEAHEFTQSAFTRKAVQGVSPLIVDNTNLQYWEMDHYMKIANQYNYKICIMEPNTPWKFNEEILSRKTQHSVPYDKIKLMKMRYETGCTVEQQLRSLGRVQVTNLQMRTYPPLVETTSGDFIDFSEDISNLKLNDDKQNKTSASVNAQSQFSNSTFQWNVPDQVFKDRWDQPDTSAPTKDEEMKKTSEPQPQRKPQKKIKSPDSKFPQHKKGCPNENASFKEIRELYSAVNDSYLWDFFVKCNGEADWCVNLLCDENLTDQMDAGETLTCDCDELSSSNDTQKTLINVETRQTPLPSPSTKKAKIKNDDEWIGAKNAIEKSIFISKQHYPDHVNAVKTWKNIDQEVEQLEWPKETNGSPVSSGSPPETEQEELYAFPITREMINDLDDNFGDGGMRNFIDSQKKLPSKIFIKKSTAMQVYLEIMECLYSQEEEKKIERAKNDEELAMKLNAEEQKQKKSNPNNNKVVTTADEKLGFFGKPVHANEWEKEKGESDDIALKMSKEKLVELFPHLNEDVILDIFSGLNNNFNETVEIITDSLVCTKEERKKIEKRMKHIFNSPWPEVRQSSSTPPVAVRETHDPDMKVELSKVEKLRQDIFDAQDEQKVLQQKTNDAVRNRQFEVATYYHNIAKFHKMRKDEAEHEVANLICEIHKNTQKSSTTIDLHYHSLMEASMLLDTFLDKNVNRIRTLQKPREDLFVITGKGNNSKNGIPTIKNKVKSRCKERKLNCAELDNNPGVIKIKIFMNSPLSNEL